MYVCNIFSIYNICKNPSELKQNTNMLYTNRHNFKQLFEQIFWIIDKKLSRTLNFLSLLNIIS